MIIDRGERVKKAPYFYEMFCEELIICDENFGKKVMLTIGNQFDESNSDLSVDYLMKDNFSWINPKERIKILLCEETARDLANNILEALKSNDKTLVMR